MRIPLFVIISLLTPLALLTGADGRAKATDYPAHGESADVAIGAEYLVHSYSSGREMLMAPDFLVVDTAVYPKQGAFTVHQTDFRLRITPAKGEPFLLEAQAPQFVGLGGPYPGLGAGGARQPRYPGSPGGSQPGPTQTPDSPDGQNQPQAPETQGQVAVRTALPEGEYHSAQAGFLFFPFSGKTKKLKRMDLIYKAAGGEVVVNLF